MNNNITSTIEPDQHESTDDIQNTVTNINKEYNNNNSFEHNTSE